MRHLLLTAMLAAAAACAPQQPIPITYENQAPTPASDGTPEQQASRRLNRAMNQETRQDRAQDSDPYAGSMAGAPTPASDFEIGGGNPDPAMPSGPGIGIPFQ
ncbi:hypothetical protein KPL78_18455 [Roseomonas sp. HJA6]|uniref:Lipoprotein n=1 Tax=Roseomonas alba TaxID=2846776 RepID=A0ABS7AC13_9PROT|nr:hypothetical protein [Neoroseomonas alba]MBW6399847.1 hypothetical protein [Neoroseomonas alba]